MLSPRTAIRGLAAVALVALIAVHPGVGPGPAGAAAMRGLNPADLDTTCKACDDFWRFATGGWQKRHTIPASYASFTSFHEMNDRNQVELRTILDRSAGDATAASDSDVHRIGTFYAACNDSAAIDANGFTALQPEIDRINAVDSISSAVTEISHLEQLGVDVGIGFGSESDTRDSSRTIAGIGFGGLGMPDRDYYLAPASAAVRTAYIAYLVKELTYTGLEPASARREANAILALETVLAKATPPNADLRDPLATYHPMPVAKLASYAPHVPWAAFLASMNHGSLETVDLNLPAFTKVFDAELASAPPATWRSYFLTHLLTTYSSALPKRFNDATFTFYRTVLNGVKQQLPLWKRCISATDDALPDPLGKLYAEQYFPPASKTRALELVNNLQATLHDDIKTLPWMSPATRTQAEMKLAAYVKKIGYPDHWIDYSAVRIAPENSYLSDRFATQLFATQLDLARIGKPTDRTRWGMSPPTINAYYSPSNNEIVFPAGILQAPFFDTAADDAVNYGAIGAIMGHEMTHGFDDTGRRFDAKGNLRDWWTASDAVAFGKRAQCIVDEYNGFAVEKGLHENGRLVQGEAIADLGGATIAFRAFRNTPEYKAHESIDGYTPEQRFFLSYAQAWRELIRPAAARQAVLVDPHPENKFRLIGTLGNMPEFQSAFSCAMNAPMVRKNRCRIW